jgi:putative lipoic acid-binding regulatory protein
MTTPQHPKNIGEGEETLLTFPAVFPIKAMGRMQSKENDEGFAQIVLAIILKHAPDFDASSVEMRPSKNGNFISVTATINAQSKAQIDAIYLELTSNPLVLMAL